MRSHTEMTTWAWLYKATNAELNNKANHSHSAIGRHERIVLKRHELNMGNKYM